MLKLKTLDFTAPNRSEKGGSEPQMHANRIYLVGFFARVMRHWPYLDNHLKPRDLTLQEAYLGGRATFHMLK